AHRLFLFIAQRSATLRAGPGHVPVLLCRPLRRVPRRALPRGAGAQSDHRLPSSPAFALRQISYIYPLARTTPRPMLLCETFAHLEAPVLVLRAHRAEVRNRKNKIVAS